MRRSLNDLFQRLEDAAVQLEDLTIAEDTLAALDEESVAAVIAFRYGQLLDAGFGLAGALMLAARTDRSLESIIAQRSRAMRAVA